MLALPTTAGHIQQQDITVGVGEHVDSDYAQDQDFGCLCALGFRTPPLRSIFLEAVSIPAGGEAGCEGGFLGIFTLVKRFHDCTIPSSCPPEPYCTTKATHDKFSRKVAGERLGRGHESHYWACASLIQLKRNM